MSRTDFDIPWRLTDHTCSACGGRILAAVEDADHVRFADCGAEAGEGTRSLCWCQNLGDAPISIRCGHNPKQSPASMAEIVAVEAPAAAQAKPPKRAVARR